MHYSIKAHPTLYKGVLYRSRLEARWAAFFGLCLWEHEYEPIDLEGWTPDFYVKIPCKDSECDEFHGLFVEVKPYFSLKEFMDHPCMKYSREGGLPPSVHAVAAFGINPRVTHFEMSHGGTRRSYEVSDWIRGYEIYKINARTYANELWKMAGNRVQWHPTN